MKRKEGQKDDNKILKKFYKKKKNSKDEIRTNIKYFIINSYILLVFLIFINLPFYKSNEITDESFFNFKHSKYKNGFKKQNEINKINQIFLNNNLNKVNTRQLDENSPDDLISEIKKKFLNGDYDTEIENLFNGNKSDIIINENNFICQITTSENQKNNYYDSKISSILLQNCEIILKNYNKIDNTPLLIFKIDYYKEGLLMPIIEYEIYSYDNGKTEKLELDICQDTEIQILTPFMNPTGEKSCISFCENNCVFDNYDSNIEKYICKCGVKTKFSLISEVKEQSWNSIEYFKLFCSNINNDIKDDINLKDDIIHKIKSDIENGTLDKILSEISNGEDILINKTDVIYQITTTENQYLDEYNGVSSIRLGDCEYILKEKYNISVEVPLLIFKVDYSKEGSSRPIVEYEVYDSLTYKKLNLSYCKNMQIDIEIPVVLKVNDLMKYDSSSKFYSDPCFTYTTEEGTDITLKDRKNEFINQDLSLCEENCTYEGYDQKSKRALCQCNVKSKLSLISEISTLKDKILDTFPSLRKRTNIFRCTSLFFSKKGLKNNIGSYILLGIMSLNICLIVFMINKGNALIQDEINKILKLNTIKSDTSGQDDENNINNNNYNINENENNTDKKSNIINNSNNSNINNNLNYSNSNNINNNNYPNDENKYDDNNNNIDNNMNNNIDNNKNNIINNNMNNNFNNNINNNYNNNIINNINNNINSNVNNKYKENKVISKPINKKGKAKKRNKSKQNKDEKKNYNNGIIHINNNNPPPKKLKLKKNENEKKIFNNNNVENPDSKIELENEKKSDKMPIDISLLNKVKKNKFHNQYKINGIEFSNYNEYELNKLRYVDALAIDKRYFFYYYFSLIKRNNIFIFAFLLSNDYNPRAIKITIFSFTISLYFAMNVVFINDAVVHALYKDKGNFYLEYHMPHIVYSIIVSAVFIGIIKFVFLSEKDIMQIRSVKEKEYINGKCSKIINYVKCKFILLYILDFILMFFFWLYVGLFCAVFKNTQIYLIKKTLISFGFYLLYPFVFCLITATFRILSLKSRNRSCLYKISQILQNI